jgi:hypothetical protein
MWGGGGWKPATINLDNYFAIPRSPTTCFRTIGEETYGFVTNVYDPIQINEKLDFLISLHNLADIIGSHLWIFWGTSFLYLLLRKKGRNSKDIKGQRSLHILHAISQTD